VQAQGNAPHEREACPFRGADGGGATGTNVPVAFFAERMSGKLNEEAVATAAIKRASSA